ncbi:hypothetical protein Tco_0842299 [Tanacetum coccineum]|uniref:Uncharacterized protein n=1 Tax=Tanacetum coccineum TaxID=301880 RepID=A0ABQ5B1K7_9ASTR
MSLANQKATTEYQASKRLDSFSISGKLLAVKVNFAVYTMALTGRSIEELEGMSWHLKPPEQTSVRVPSRVVVNERLNRSVRVCSQAPQEGHISYDVMSCESCLNEARILEEEPLNKVRRSNKPKRSKQKSSEKWSTLGEPSGKWDYYVRYDAPPDITPIEEVAATGWGDEFSDDEEE